MSDETRREAEQEELFPSEMESAFADGRVWLIVDEPRPYGRHSSAIEGPCPHWDEPVRWVHVMSRPAGGEIRGYALVEGELRLRLPNYSGDWPEMDAAVRARVAS